eukprot:Pgem_evm1s6722
MEDQLTNRTACLTKLLAKESPTRGGEAKSLATDLEFILGDLKDKNPHKLGTCYL